MSGTGMFGGDPVAEASAILARAVDDHRPVAVVGLFSGGTDSHCATQLASEVVPLKFVAHINTQTGIRQTLEHVRATCAAKGWALREYTPPMIRQFGGRTRLVTPAHPDARTAYEAYCYHFGMPGPRQHTMVYQRLKDRCVARITRELKRRRGDRVLFVSGVRRSESKRRMGYDQPVQVEGGRVWVAPLLFWSDADKEGYMRSRGIVKSEVSRQLCMSGECLCGCYASPGELDEIALFFPEAAAYLRELTRRVRAANPKSRGWGERPPRKEKRKPADQPGQRTIAGLCWSCEAKSEGNS